MHREVTFDALATNSFVFSKITTQFHGDSPFACIGTVRLAPGKGVNSLIFSNSYIFANNPFAIYEYLTES